MYKQYKFKPNLQFRFYQKVQVDAPTMAMLLLRILNEHMALGEQGDAEYI